MTTGLPSSLVRGLVFSLGLGLAAAGMADPVVQPKADSTANPSADPAAGPVKADGLEEIVVTGYRASLEKSLDMKRDAPVVLDSVNATELGRFPDADVADSLQHLPGITISRTTGGEGQKVTVRGFGPQYNIVTMNNRILATDDDGRDLAFDVLPSEIISGADVLKASQASALEGSIGGTVNLRTGSPFDTPGLHAGVHAEGNYNQMSDLKGQKYSAFLSNTFADDKLGFLLGVVHSDNKTRTDALNNNNQYTYGPAQYPFDGAAGTGTPISVAPYSTAFGSIFDEKKRDALSGSIEWRPSDNFKLVADGMFTQLRDPQNGYYQSYYFPYATTYNADGTPGTPLWSNPTINNGLVTGVTSAAFQPEAVNSSLNRNVNTQLYGLNADWKVSDRLSLNFDVYHSRADRPEGGGDTYVTSGLVTTGPTAVDTLVYNDVPHSLPSINVLIPPSQLGLGACPGSTGSATNPGSCSYTSLLNGGYLNNNNLWSSHYAVLNGYSVRDQIDSGTLAGKMKIEWGPLQQIQFGFADSHRQKSRDDYDNTWNNGAGEYGTLYNTAGCPIQCSPYSFSSQGYNNVLSVMNVPNFMEGAGGSYPSVLPAINVGQLLNFFKSLDGKDNPYFCTAQPCSGQGLFNYSAFLPQLNPFNSYKVTEKTISGYLQSDWSGDRWSGNLGVRIVHTETNAQYAQSVPTAVWTNNAGQSSVVYNVIYDLSAQTNTKSSYTLPLPSLNFAYWLDPGALQLRAAVAKVMSRPDLNQLAPNSTDGAQGGRPEIYRSGTPGLRPIKSWQTDLALEWYYHPRAALTLGLFDKRVTDDIYNGVTQNVDLGTKLYIGGPPGTAGVPGTPFIWTVYGPANGAKETYDGIELTWQHLLDNGLGAHVQVTRTWSKGSGQNGVNNGPVNTAPPTTASISLLYERGPVSANVNWDYTSSYRSACSTCTEVSGWPVITDSYQWVTASVHYKFTKEFDMYVEGRNLTDAIVRSYLDGNPSLVWANGQNVGQSSSGVGSGYTAYGRSFVLGAAYRF